MDLKSYLDNLPRGGMTEFSASMGVSKSYLSQLASGRAPISPQRCVQIEKISGGAVSRRDLRDDWHLIWPELDDESTAA